MSSYRITDRLLNLCATAAELDVKGRRIAGNADYQRAAARAQRTRAKELAQAYVEDGHVTRRTSKP